MFGPSDLSHKNVGIILSDYILTKTSLYFLLFGVLIFLTTPMSILHYIVN